MRRCVSEPLTAITDRIGSVATYSAGNVKCSLTRSVCCLKVASEEKSLEKKLKDICCQNKVKVQTFWGSTLYHRDDLPFGHIRG